MTTERKLNAMIKFIQKETEYSTARFCNNVAVDSPNPDQFYLDEYRRGYCNALKFVLRCTAAFLDCDTINNAHYLNKGIYSDACVVRHSTNSLQLTRNYLRKECENVYDTSDDEYDEMLQDVYDKMYLLFGDENFYSNIGVGSLNAPMCANELKDYVDFEPNGAEYDYILNHPDTAGKDLGFPDDIIAQYCADYDMSEPEEIEELKK